MHEPGSEARVRTFFEWSVDEHSSVPSRAVVERAARYGLRAEDRKAPAKPDHVTGCDVVHQRAA
jgi:hypothetical protein